MSEFECVCFPVGHPAHGARHKESAGCDRWAQESVVRAGRKAFSDGHNIADCPYDMDSSEWDLWVRGYQSAPSRRSDCVDEEFGCGFGTADDDASDVRNVFTISYVLERGDRLGSGWRTKRFATEGFDNRRPRSAR